LAIAGGGQSAQPVPDKVTLVYFPCRLVRPKRLTPALEKMAAADADIALRKIDLTNGGSEEYNIMALPVVKVYDRSGGLVGTAVGDDVNEVKSYVTQAKGG
jgi:hypothetical protein